MASAYKLTYFDLTGAGEPIRLLFSYGGIEFEDVRIKPTPDWFKIKDKYPFGQLPVLEYNGKVIHQSSSITRYVGKLVKLGGNDDWEDLEIDAAVDSLRDLMSKLSPMFHEGDATKWAEMKENHMKDTLPYYMEKFNKIVQNNNGHVAVGRLTWADIFWVATFGYMGEKFRMDIIASYPNLVALRNNVMAIPSIKAWADKQSKSVK